MARHDEWPTTQPHEAAGEEQAIRTLPVVFTGSGNDYFRIWIASLALTLVTLGLYWPFARARRLAWFHAHTRVGKDALAFHGDPWTMFRGHLVMVVLGLLYWAVSEFEPSLAWVPLLVLVLLWPALWRASLRFRLRNTSWRGVRLAFVGNTAGAYAAWLPLFIPMLVLVGLVPAADENGEISREAARRFAFLAGVLTLCVLLLAPWLLKRLKRFQHDGYACSHEQTRLHAGTSAFYGLAFGFFSLAVRVALVALAVSLLFHLLLPGQVTALLTTLTSYLLVPLLLWPWFTAHLQNLLWNHTWSRRVRFNSDLSFGRLVALTAGNWLLIAVTLGLYWPFAEVRKARLKLHAMSVDIEGDVTAWLAQVDGRLDGAMGDAAGDFLGIDMGL